MGKKRLVAVIAILLLTFVFSISVYADVLWEPDNDFYWNHSDECEIEQRNYVTLSETFVLDRPNGEKAIAKIENNVRLFVSFTYTDGDGKLWGEVEIENEYGIDAGWISLESAVVEYDYISFDEDHSSEYAQYSGQLADIDENTSIEFWTYPNSGVVWYRVDDLNDSDNDIADSVEGVYTDENGMEWCKIGYWCGIKNCWVCADDVSGSKLKEVELTYNNSGISSDVSDFRLASEGIADWVYPIILVAFVVLLTVIIVITVGVSRKSKKE